MLVATFLVSLVIAPSSPFMEHPRVRDLVSVVSGMNDESIEERVESEEAPGQEAVRSVREIEAGP